MTLIRHVSLGLVLVLGLQACGKETKTKVVDNPKVSQENEKLKAELAASTEAKQKQEQLLKFAQSQNLVKPSEVLTALDLEIAAAGDEKKAQLEGLRDFYKSILPEGGDVTTYCTKLIDLAVEKDLLKENEGRDLKLEGSAPVFEKPGDTTSKLVGMAPCSVVYNSLFE